MLREYQTRLVEQVKEAYRNGYRAPCIVLPCGGGKSIIVAEMAKKTTVKGNNVLFLVHRKELCEQIENTFCRWGVDMELCQIMMVQTACRHIDRIQDPVLIITDENHHGVARSYKKIYEAFPHAYRVGVTATPERIDGKGLHEVNDILVIGENAQWLIDNNFLAPYLYKLAKIGIDEKKLRTRHGEFTAESVEDAMGGSCIADVVEGYIKNAEGKQAICYTSSRSLSKKFADSFCEHGIAAAHFDAETPKSERAEIIRKFRKGELTVLCNVDLISEGFDVPDCEVSILERPTKSLTVFIQQSMRCMRYKPGKKAVIIDCVNNVGRHGLPTEERQWSLEDKPKGKSEIRIKTCPKCYAVVAPAVKECPECGYIFEEEKKPRAEKEVAHGVEYVEVGFKTKYIKTAADCTDYADLRAFGKSKGYKPGWAYYQAKARGWI